MSTLRDERAQATVPAAAQRDGVAKLQLQIGGMHCSLCVESIRKALGRLAGVQEVQVSLAHEEVLVTYDPRVQQPARLIETLQALGYTVHEPDHPARFAAEERELRAARRAALLAGALLLLASGLMAWTLLAGPAPWRALALGALAGFTALGPARPILFRNGWQSLRRGILNQDVLASAAALGGLLGGGVGLVLPAFPAGGFFGATVFVLAFHLIGGYLSVLVHVRASQSVRQLLSLVPPRARRLDAAGHESEVAVEALVVGDRVRVRPGERIPIDGVVVEGASAVDESLVTGEAMPVDKLPGEEVIGGALNLTGTLVLQVTRTGPATFLQTVSRQVAEARALKPGLLRLVDRVLLVYVPVVFGLSVASLLLWTLGPWVLTGAPDLARAGFAALSVLIMGYPCALGMATPLAIVRGSGEAARRGILMRSGEAFHVFKDVRTIAWDKTGTLTEGKPALVAVHALDGDPAGLLRWAASAEYPSEHPLARALVAAAQRADLPLRPPSAFEARPGRGVSAVVDGVPVLVGTAAFLTEAGIAVEPLAPLAAAEQAQGRTVVWVAVGGRPAGVLALADQLKPDAREALAALRARGLRSVLLSGDHARAAQAVAAACGIEEVVAELLPGEKAAYLRRLQAAGQRVAMVGDGINDAPALMQADVGIAIGAGTDIAIESADIALVGGRLLAVAEAYELARRSYQLTATNVGLALSFNGVGIVAATTGLVEPAWAMVAMAVSVSTVLAHSFAGRLLPRRAAALEPR
ncbi:MAG TPA: cation-translocating P-type ATPase [Chloroflexota bacterium]|nr:cation-translocating P-type ATPase [Chloroflexota bacterium]